MSFSRGFHLKSLNLTGVIEGCSIIKTFGGGDTYMLRHTGMFLKNGLFFSRNPKTWVPFSFKNP